MKQKQKKPLLEHTIEKAGLPVKADWLRKILFGLALLVNMGLSIYLLFFFSSKTYPIIYVFIAIVVIWILIFFLLLALIWLCFYLFLDVQIFKRTRSVEEVLPDFLQLTATNVRAGMTIDKALWFAIRPRFGILAKEIETVAKEVMSGEELTDALQRFSDKYNSGILKESINLMIEGINAGSEIGDLLSRISQNIQEVNTIQKEMAANVTSYVIFITFSAIIASPILLALSKQLIVIIDQLVKSIGPLPRQSMLSLTQMGISAADFHFFAVTSTAITSICSAMMISVIKKGNVKEGLKYIPTFLVIALVLYYLSLKVMGAAFGNLFG